MLHRTLLTTAAVALLGACSQASAPADNAAAAVTQDEAAKAFDATVVEWDSMDPARLKAVYAPDFAGFDYSVAPLVTDKAGWDKVEEQFATAKLDKLTVKNKKIQILGPDAFVVSFEGMGTSSTMPQNNGEFRCTDIYHREAGGPWLIVTEHCSTPPKAA
jgi:hypothetical protein